MRKTYMVHIPTSTCTQDQANFARPAQSIQHPIVQQNFQQNHFPVRFSQPQQQPKLQQVSQAKYPYKPFTTSPAAQSPNGLSTNYWCKVFTTSPAAQSPNGLSTNYCWKLFTTSPATQSPNGLSTNYCWKLFTTSPATQSPNGLSTNYCWKLFTTSPATQSPNGLSTNYCWTLAYGAMAAARVF